MKLIVVIMAFTAINTYARTGDVSYKYETMIQEKRLDSSLRVPNSLDKKEKNKLMREKENSEVGEENQVYKLDE